MINPHIAMGLYGYFLSNSNDLISITNDIMSSTPVPVIPTNCEGVNDTDVS